MQIIFFAATLTCYFIAALYLSQVWLWSLGEATIACYFLAFVFYSLSLSLGKDILRFEGRMIYAVGILHALFALGMRWYQAGHPPLSNMYESMITLSTFIAIAGFCFTIKRPIALLEGGSVVGALVMLGIANLFCDEARPLMPVLESYWLHMHVTLAFLGEACFAIACILSYLYCFRQHITGDYGKNRTVPVIEKLASAAIVFFLPVTFLAGMSFLAFYLRDHPGYDSAMRNILLGVVLPGTLALAVLFVVSIKKQKAFGEKFENWLPEPELIDTLTYRAIAIGYPLFTVGAIIFGMVWANQAWGRYWGWDPKETWSLITFLVYSLYLHVRLMRGWKGTWTAVISVVGFVVTMFTLFGVNFLISSLHSYT